MVGQRIINNILGNSPKVDRRSKNKKTVPYVSVFDPLQIEYFELYKAPTGWLRYDIIQERIKNNKDYRDKFTIEELNIINNIRE